MYLESPVKMKKIVASHSEKDIKEELMKEKILVVDDDVLMAQMIKLTLERTCNYEVRVETDALNAVSVARTFKPKLILLDIIMKNLGGEDIACIIKEDRELRHIKIVFLTALLTKDEIGGLGKKIGRFWFLAKPVTDDELLSVIDRKLGMR